MIFDKHFYNNLHKLFTLPGYAGYRPQVKEAPNGDGKIDADKRYLHVALKYNPPPWAISYLALAHWEACRIAEALKTPDHLYPKVENGTLRVLEYPAGAGSAEHTDFDLFTVMCYRNIIAPFKRTGAVDSRAESIDPHAHIGEIGELAGIGQATPHLVEPRPYIQRSIVYFAMPAMDALLPTGTTVREWLAERMSRSRY